MVKVLTFLKRKSGIPVAEFQVYSRSLPRAGAPFSPTREYVIV